MLAGLDEQRHAWALRGAWASHVEVTVRLEHADVPRVRGKVSYVAVTGAFAVIQGIHVPCALILSVRKPHFSEPLDQAAPPSRAAWSAHEQLSLEGL